EECHQAPPPGGAPLLGTTCTAPRWCPAAPFLLSPPAPCTSTVSAATSRKSTALPCTEEGTALAGGDVEEEHGEESWPPRARRRALGGAGGRWPRRRSRRR